MALSFHIQTRTRSIADIVRVMSVLRHAEKTERERAYGLFGVQLAPLHVDAPPPDTRERTGGDEMSSLDGAEAGPHRPDSIQPRQDPAVSQLNVVADDFDASNAMPQRRGDQPAVDIPPESGETGQAELIVPETERRERLFEDIPDAEEQRLVPLLDPRRSSNILREICSVLQPSSTVDVMRLLAIASRGLPMPAKLPYKAVCRPARRVAVAYDATDRMTTFLDDADSVKEQIGRVTNAQIIDLPWEVIEDLSDNERGRHPTQLRPGTHLLFLADLGFGDWARQREWRLPTPQQLRRLADDFARLGVTTSALLPVSAAKWESALPSRIAGLSWDRASTPATARRAMKRSREGAASHFGRKLREHRRGITGLAQFRAAYRPLEGGPVKPLAEADRVALTAVFCSRVSPPRLRSLRMAMLPRSSPEAEAQAWHSGHFIRYPSQVALVNQKSLDAIRNQAISWTRLVWVLERYAPGAFEIWPSLVSTPDETSEAGPILRPSNWPRARRALEQALAIPELAVRLVMMHPEWRPELYALLNGRGCVILEEARDLARAHAPTHITDPFEDALLWDAYLDSFSENRANVARRLARLEQSLTNILYKDEYRAGLDWTQYRLPRQSAIVQRNWQAQRLAMLAREILGFDMGILPAANTDRADASSSPGGVELSENRQEQRDLYVWSPYPDVWRLRLEYGPEEQMSGMPLPIRIRVPAHERITLELSGNDRSEDLEVYRTQGREFSWAGNLTIRTFQGASYPITAPRASDGADIAFWLRHASKARLAGDWTAATRWARRATDHTPNLAAIFHLAKASAISEEYLDGALARIEDVAHLAEKVRPSVLLWRSVLAAFFRMALLEVDSRLNEAVAAGQAALNLLAASDTLAASAYRLRIGAAITRYLQRRMELRAALPTIRSMLRDIKRLGPHRRFRLVRLACAEALSALNNAALEGAKPRLAARIVQEAVTLPRRGDQEIEMIVRLTEARYASYYAPATRTVALYDRGLESARRSGRFDVFLSDAIDYCRILYNSARIPKAAEVVAELLDRSLARRSVRRSANAYDERAYQLKFQHGGIEIADARAAALTTPEEERRLAYRTMTTSERWLREEARLQGVDPQELIRPQAEAAGNGGLLFTELLALYEMFKYVHIDREAGRRGLAPPPTMHEARLLYLALSTGDNLGAANAFGKMAQVEFPRWTGQWRIQERTNPNELYEQCIAICEKIEVAASVLNFRNEWAQELVAGGEAARALQVIDAAIRYGVDRKGLDIQFGMARATRGDILRILGRREEAKDELQATAAAALQARTLQPLLEARAHLARLAADEGDWATALEHLEFIDQAASAPMLRAYELPGTENYTVLIWDIVDGKALDRLEEAIASRQEQENPEARGEIATPGARARNFQMRGRREREKANRRAVWQTFTSKAGYLLQRSITDGGRALPNPEYSFSNLWYWGRALTRAGSSQAIWFLTEALQRADLDEKVPQKARRDVEALLATARSFIMQGA